MKKELKDYLHFYLGCKVLVKEGVGRFCEIARRSNCSDRIQVKFDCVVTKYYEADGSHNKLSSDSHCYYIGYEEIKPILRPLSDMTDDEFNNAIEPMNYGLKNLRGAELNLQAAEITRFLLSKNFDLFELIEAGLAVNAAELQTVNK